MSTREQLRKSPSGALTGALIGVFNRLDELFQRNSLRVLGALIEIPAVAPGGEDAVNIDLGRVDAREYGAVGDGSTDDTLAIQTAIAANPSSPIHFPEGNYLVTSPVTIDAEFAAGARITASSTTVTLQRMPSPDGGHLLTSGTGKFLYQAAAVQQLQHYIGDRTSVGTPTNLALNGSNATIPLSSIIDDDEHTVLGFRVKTWPQDGSAQTKFDDIRIGVSYRSSADRVELSNGSSSLSTGTGSASLSVSGSDSGLSYTVTINQGADTVAIQTSSATSLYAITTVWHDRPTTIS